MSINSTIAYHLLEIEASLGFIVEAKLSNGYGYCPIELYFPSFEP